MFYEKVKDYSSYQLQLIRARFLRYVVNNTPNHFEKLDWTSVYEDFVKTTGVTDYPAESLRQNIDSKNKSRGLGPRDFSEGHVERIHALIRYLETVGYLYSGELSTRFPFEPAADALQLFFTHQGEVDYSLLSRFDGYYEGFKENKVGDENLQLEIQYTSSDVLVRVSAFTLYEDFINEYDDYGMCSFGWAVGQHNRYLFFLSNLLKQQIVFSVLKTKPIVTSGESIEDMALFEYNGVMQGAMNKAVQLLKEDSVGDHIAMSSYERIFNDQECVCYLTRK